MTSSSVDFLDAIERSFQDRDSFMDYLDRSYELGELSGKFNIVGALNNLEGGKAEFSEKASEKFTIVNQTGDLYLLHTTVEEEPVYSYLYNDDDVPIFLTRANKTDQIPPTIWRFLQTTQGLGRLMLSRRELDELRKKIVGENNNVILPYFTAKRAPDSNVSARRRPDTERLIEYRGIDGLEAYREMRYNYGVLPRIMVFEKPNQFKFKLKSDGTLVHHKGRLSVLWACLQEEISRVKEMKKYAKTGGYGKMDSSFFGEDSFNVSRPWAIQIPGGIDADRLDSFETHLDEGFWEFSVSEFTAYPEVASFQAEIIDDATHERTTMKTKGDQVRVYPREFTDIDQSLRIYNFLGDHFDADCNPKKVA